MNKKTLMYVVGAVAIIGVVVIYRRYKNKQKSANNSSNNLSFEPELDMEDSSNASGEQIGTMACASSNQTQCQTSCENMGGTYNANGDRKCYKNGVAISGGMFGGMRMANKQTK